MNNLVQREILSAAYNRAIKRGDRAEAKRIWRDLFAVTCQVLRGV